MTRIDKQKMKSNNIRQVQISAPCCCSKWEQTLCMFLQPHHVILYLKMPKFMYMCFVVRKLILRLLFVEKLLDWHLEIMVFIFMSSETTPMVWWFSFVRIGTNAVSNKNPCLWYSRICAKRDVKLQPTKKTQMFSRLACLIIVYYCCF